MAQHGYLHDTYDRDDFGRGGRDDDRERSWRDRDDDHRWRGRDEERGRHDHDSRWSDHDDRGSMFGWRDQDRHSSDRGHQDRGYWGSSNQSGSWSGSDHGWDRQQDSSGSGSRDWQGQSGWGGGRSGGQQQGWSSGSSSHSQQGGQRYSAHPDDHYRSWRDKQMQSLDRDYQDYCREREQQFHSDFDTWRQNRQSSSGQSSGQNSMNQGSGGHSQHNEMSNDAMELDQEANRGGDIEGATASPMGAATMGTSNSENTASAPGATGRGKR